MTKTGVFDWEHKVGDRVFRVSKHRATAREDAHSGHQYAAFEDFDGKEIRHFSGTLFTTLRAVQDRLDRQAPKYKPGVIMPSYGDPQGYKR